MELTAVSAFPNEFNREEAKYDEVNFGEASLKYDQLVDGSSQPEDAAGYTLVSCQATSSTFRGECQCRAS